MRRDPRIRLRVYAWFHLLLALPGTLLMAAALAALAVGSEFWLGMEAALIVILVTLPAPFMLAAALGLLRGREGSRRLDLYVVNALLGLECLLALAGCLVGSVAALVVALVLLLAILVRARWMLDPRVAALLRG